MFHSYCNNFVAYKWIHATIHDVRVWIEGHHSSHTTKRGNDESGFATYF